MFLAAKREVICPACGVLNRVAAYSFRRVPECGKCHAKLPETKTIEIARRLYRFPRVAWLSIPVVALIGWIMIPASIKTPDQCAGHPQPREGIYKWYGPAWGPDVAGFTIKTAPGSNYFVKLEDELHHPVRAYFVKGGSTVFYRVPLGTFTLKYASGEAWCRVLFGADTSANVADDTFTFERATTADGYSISDWTVELIRQRGGNLRTHSIPRDQF